MKSNILKTLIWTGLACGSLSAHAQQPTATLDSTPLKIYGDSVKFEARIQVPKHKIFKKEGTYVIMPELGDQKFEPIRISSKDLNNAAMSGIDITVTSSALFDEDMIGNDLEIEHEYEYKNGRKNVEFKDMDDLAECCVTTGTLFSLNGQYELMTFDYTPPTTVPLKVVAQINFPLDVSKFSPQESMPAIKAIGNYIKNYPTSTITIRGFSSPEGTTARNIELAEQRAQAAKSWIIKTLNANGYSPYYSEADIKVESVKEDWEGFKYVVKRSDLSKEKQNSILNILSQDLGPNEKEDKVLAELGGIDKAERFLMPLRRTTIVAADEYAKRVGYTPNQIDSINAQYEQGNLSLSSLKDIYSQEEFLQASQRTNAKSGKITLLNSFNETYPGDTRVYSNLGALSAAIDLDLYDVVGGDDALVGVGFSRDMVDIDEEWDLDGDKLKYKYKYKEEDVKDGKKFKMKFKADLADAELLLNKAYEVDTENFVALNNLGAHYLTVGEYAKAKEYLDKSARYQDSEGVNYNLGVYNAIMGNYQKAHDHFMKSPSVKNIQYNRGLAKLMVGDNIGAMKDFETFSRNNAEYALGHYLTAVAAARTENKEVMIRELEHAMNRDKKLSDIAEEDLEFRNYWNEKWFKNASDDDFDATTSFDAKGKD